MMMISWCDTEKLETGFTDLSKNISWEDTLKILKKICEYSKQKMHVLSVESKMEKFVRELGYDEIPVDQERLNHDRDYEFEVWESHCALPHIYFATDIAEIAKKFLGMVTEETKKEYPISEDDWIYRVGKWHLKLQKIYDFGDDTNFYYFSFCGFMCNPDLNYKIIASDQDNVGYRKIKVGALKGSVHNIVKPYDYFTYQDENGEAWQTCLAYANKKGFACSRYGDAGIRDALEDNVFYEYGEVKPSL